MNGAGASANARRESSWQKGRGLCRRAFAEAPASNRSASYGDKSNDRSNGRLVEYKDGGNAIYQTPE
ncbi:MAG TPA: hypothetical protein VF534_03355 [Paraburkholderia sp.]